MGLVVIMVVARPSALRIESRLVGPDEGADVVGHVEELDPLLLAEREPANVVRRSRARRSCVTTPVFSRRFSRRPRDSRMISAPYRAREPRDAINERAMMRHASSSAPTRSVAREAVAVGLIPTMLEGEGKDAARGAGKLHGEPQR